MIPFFISFGAPARADITIVQQHAYIHGRVSASVFGKRVVDRSNTSDLLTGYSDSVTATLDGGRGFGSLGTAFGTNSITVGGQSSARGYAGGSGSAAGMGTSSLTLQFQVTTTALYTITMATSRSSYASSSVSLQLLENGVAIVPGKHSGTYQLKAGAVYEIDAGAGSSASQSLQFPSATFNLSITPAP